MLVRVGVLVGVMLVRVALVWVVNVPRLVPVVLVRVALMRVVGVLLGMMLVRVALVRVVDVPRLVPVMLVRVALVRVVHFGYTVYVLVGYHWLSFQFQCGVLTLGGLQYVTWTSQAYPSIKAPYLHHMKGSVNWRPQNQSCFGHYEDEAE